MDKETTMTNFNDTLTAGTQVGILNHGRRYTSASTGTVTKVTPKQVVVDVGHGTRRFDRRSGYEIGHGSGSMVPIDSERFVSAMQEQAARNEAAQTASKLAAEAREERFGLKALAAGDAAVHRGLDMLATEALSLEDKINYKLTRTTAENLYRELKWLEDMATASASLSYILAIFKRMQEVAGMPDAKSVTEQLKDYRDYSREQLLRPSSTLYQLEDRAQFLAHRDVGEKLTSIIEYTIGTK